MSFVEVSLVLLLVAVDVSRVVLMRRWECGVQRGGVWWRGQVDIVGVIWVFDFIMCELVGFEEGLNW